MTNHKQRDSDKGSGPLWMAFMTMVVFVVISAWLAVLRKWTLIQVLMVIFISLLFLILVLLGWAFLSEGQKGLSDTLKTAKEVFLNDLGDILNCIGIKTVKDEKS